MFKDLQTSVETNLGTSKQGVVCVPLLYFVTHLEDHPEGENQEVSFLQRPETYQELLQITSKVLMKDPAFLSSIVHSFADIMAGFFMGVGGAVKNIAPEATPDAAEDLDSAEPPSVEGSNVSSFRSKKKFMPDLN